MDDDPDDIFAAAFFFLCDQLNGGIPNRFMPIHSVIGWRCDRTDKRKTAFNQTVL